MRTIKIAILSTAHAFNIDFDFFSEFIEPLSGENQAPVQEDEACIGPNCPGVIQPPPSFGNECENTINGLIREQSTFDVADGEVLDDLYEQILEAWYNKP